MTTTTTGDAPAADKIERFLSWLVESGASISPSVSIAPFPEYGGGYGIVALTDPAVQALPPPPPPQRPTTIVVHALQDLFTIPASVITSPESVLRSPAYRTIPHFRRRLQSAVDAHFLSPLVRQDAIIALHIVVECALGKDAALGPYLDVLPHDVVPRLDTFDDDELESGGRGPGVSSITFA